MRWIFHCVTFRTVHPLVELVPTQVHEVRGEPDDAPTSRTRLLTTSVGSRCRVGQGEAVLLALRATICE